MRRPVRWPYKGLRFPGLLLLVLLVVPGAAEADRLEESRRKLAEIRNRIQRTSSELQDKKAKARDLQTDLRTVESELTRMRERLDELTRRHRRLENKIDARKQQAEKLQRSIVARRGQIRDRLTALYKNGESGLIRVLFADEPPARKAENVYYLNRIVRQDRKLLAEYRRRLEELDRTRQRLVELRREQEEALADEREHRRTLDRARELKSQLLAEARSAQATLDAQLRELRKRAARLTDLIKDLESEYGGEYTGETGFSGQKGQLSWPVRGSVKVGFGTGKHPELGTRYESQGIEVEVDPGAPVKAVWPGKVVFAERFSGYGKLIIIDHGDNFYTLYAQASRLLRKSGDLVAKNETVAEAGFGGRGRFYFEIRHRDAPLNPEKWLTPNPPQ